MVNIGVIGTGTVGSGVIGIYQKNGERLTASTGEAIRLKSVCDLDFCRCPYNLSEFQQTQDQHAILSDPEIQIVVELIGGEHPAGEIIAEALKSGKHVVTANKLVMAKHGKALLELAAEKKVSLLFEAAVAGAIPIIAALHHSLQPNRIQGVYGIVNGTTNFILTQMHQRDADFQEVLREAQRLGYAEADPSSDIEGLDSLYKLCLLAAVAFQAPIPVENVLVEGISAITAQDLRFVKSRGGVVKLIALARHTKGKLELRVHPTILASSHPLAGVNDVFNAVYVQGDCSGDLMFYGPGAGGIPTASAVWADILAIADKTAYRPILSNCCHFLPSEEMESKYYFRFQTDGNRIGIAEICAVFAAHRIGIQEVLRVGSGEETELLVNTDKATEKDKNMLLRAVSVLPGVKKRGSVIRIGL